jgi:hypothetical protein
MQVLEFEVREQEIFRLGPDFVASNTINFLTCKFNFDASWVGLIRYASFTTDLETAAQVELEDDECVIPSWLIAEPTTLHIAAIGFDSGQNVQATTQYTSVDIHLGALANTGAEPPPDEPRNYYTKVEVDLLLNELEDEVGGIPIGTEPPTEGRTGDLFFDTDNE